MSTPYTVRPGEDVVFVTGVTGLVGSQVVSQLLEAGYRVRGAVRPPKLSSILAALDSHPNKSNFEAVTVEDVGTSDLTAAFEGGKVKAVIHTAAVLPWATTTAEQVVKGAVEGCMNVVRQSYDAGVRRIVVTSSVATAKTPEMTFRLEDWCPSSVEDALRNSDRSLAYDAGKTQAELQLWKFQDEHPDADITTLNPPFIYGPLPAHFPIPPPSPSALSTNAMILNLLHPTGPIPGSARYVDVRDVARAHILALSSVPYHLTSKDIGHKRVIFSSPHAFDFAHTLEYLKKQRPDIASRLSQLPLPLQYNIHDYEGTDKPIPAGAIPDRMPQDYVRLEKVLGMRKEDMRTTEETMLDTVSWLVDVVEVDWKKRGLENGPMELF